MTAICVTVAQWALFAFAIAMALAYLFIDERPTGSVAANGQAPR